MGFIPFGFTVVDVINMMVDLLYHEMHECSNQCSPRTQVSFK